MTRKSSSTQQRQRSSGKQAGSGRSRSQADTAVRQSASSPRGNPQSDRGRSRSDRSDRAQSSGRSRDNQEWNFAQPSRAYADSRRDDERSFGSRDYEPGRERPAYAAQSDRGRGFAPRDQDRRGEFASRGNPEQNERRFTREMDSYYGRSSRPQEIRERSFRGEDDYRSSGRDEPGPWPQNSREDEYRSSPSRREPARSNYDDYDRRPFPRGDYSSVERQQNDRDDFRREEGYADDDRSYQGSAREGGRYDREDDDRFYAGRGQRGSESESSGQRRQSSGSRSDRSTASSQRRR